MFSLSITLIKAENLPASDFGFLGMGGKSDPYVKFKVASHIQKSSVINSNLSPSWNPQETFVFQIDDPKARCLEIQVYDYDRFNADDLLATTSIALAPFLDTKGYSEVIAYELDVVNEYEKQKCHSLLYLQVQLTSHQDADQILELWENERYHIVKGWTSETFLPTDRQRWSMVNNSSMNSSHFEKIAPSIPYGMTGEGWSLDISQGDCEGWIYAVTFQGPWHRKANTLTIVRRRKWINKCTLDRSNNQYHLQ